MHGLLILLTSWGEVVLPPNKIAPDSALPTTLDRSCSIVLSSETVALTYIYRCLELGTCVKEDSALQAHT